MRNLCLAGLVAACGLAVGLASSASALAVYQSPNLFATTDYGVQTTIDPHAIVGGPIWTIDRQSRGVHFLHPMAIDTAQRVATGGGGYLMSQAAMVNGCGAQLCQPACAAPISSCGLNTLSQGAVYEAGVTVGRPALGLGLGVGAGANVLAPAYAYPNLMGTDKYPLIDLQPN